ncbi:MAG: DUF4124 domain-containing protein [Thermodesulfobacteriota bacterium]
MSIFSINTVNSLTLYKWTDEDGVVHYSDKKPDKKAEILKLPKRTNPDKEIVIEEETVYENNEQQLIEETIEEDIKLYWRNLALGLEEKKERVLEEIFVTEKKIEILKRNIDYYLINGYSADFMILDLRYLEGQLPPLFKQLELIELEKEQLRRDARKQGIPPGYLRP